MELQETPYVGPGLSRGLRIARWLRWLLKATIWTGVSTALDRLGYTLATVQVLCIDREIDHMLVLRTPLDSRGYTPVQGLRRGSVGLGLVPLRADVREDARRELEEEAVLNPSPVEDFWVAERYREGAWGQFDCTVLVVFGRRRELRLRAETDEGAPCWLPIPEALRLLGRPRLRELVEKWQDDPEQTESADRRRFLIAPGHLPKPEGGGSATDDVPSWSMPLVMLAEARAAGHRTADAVYHANPDFAAQLWEGMDTSARDCYRPDPRRWRDCRLLDAPDLGTLLRGWEAARLELLASPAQTLDARTIAGRTSPQAALALQRRSGNEFSLDLIYDSERDLVACFVTRGCLGGIMSDVLLYALISARFVVIPIFHTHPSQCSDRGYKQPSTADYWVMQSLYLQMDGAPVGDCVASPDGSLAEYGISAGGQVFYRRTADPLLPEGGESFYSFADVQCPSRRRRY
jgi:hypothetical protein